MVIKPAEFIDVGPPPEEGAANEAMEKDTESPTGPRTLRKPNSDLPYTFARRHGVLLEAGTDGQMMLVHQRDHGRGSS